MARIPGRSHTESLKQRCQDPEYAWLYIQELHTTLNEAAQQLREARKAAFLEAAEFLSGRGWYAATEALRRELEK